MFNIRYVTESDKSFWFSLDEYMSVKEFDLKVRDQRGYVISDGNQPIGVMRYSLFWDNLPFLNLIHLEEAFQGEGFGKQAIQVWENDMRELGYSMVMTSTQVDEEAHHFYRKLGYVEKGSLTFDHTPYEQPMEIVMMKVL